MIYKFFREKNALSLKDKQEVISLDDDQIINELLKKMEEKISMIDVIFDKFARDVYLKNKNKTIPENVAEIDIQKKISIRVLVDYFDLIYSFAKLREIDKDKLFNNNDIFKNMNHLKNRLFKAIYLLKTKNDFEEALKDLMSIVMSLANHFEIGKDLIEKELEKVNEKEGSFLNGKLVKYD